MPLCSIFLSTASSALVAIGWWLYALDALIVSLIWNNGTCASRRITSATNSMSLRSCSPKSAPSCASGAGASGTASWTRAFLLLSAGSSPSRGRLPVSAETSVIVCLMRVYAASTSVFSTSFDSRSFACAVDSRMMFSRVRGVMRTEMSLVRIRSRSSTYASTTSCRASSFSTGWKVALAYCRYLRRKFTLTIFRAPNFSVGLLVPSSSSSSTSWSGRWADWSAASAELWFSSTCPAISLLCSEDWPLSRTMKIRSKRDCSDSGRPMFAAFSCGT
mmetsp:Transcript_65450/g.108902  ORF Transcript_65450/g.108902 Transcript_65450/m.108902 type:complete len:275 (-) Transcript_65450:97-921(-)